MGLGLERGSLRRKGVLTTTELLHEHAKPGGLRGSSVSSHGKELLEDVAVLRAGLFNLDKLVRQVHVTGSLDIMLSKLLHRGEGIAVFSLIKIPARAFWELIDEGSNNQGWKRGGANHPAPLGVVAQEVRVLESQGRDEAQHDTKGGPHLPHHGEGATDGLGGAFGGINWRGAGLGTDSETEDKTGSEQGWQARGDRLPDTCDEGEDA